MSLFSLLTLLLLFAEIAVYVGSLISPSFLPASQRRVMIKHVRNLSKNKNAQFAFVAGFSIVGALLAESGYALARVWNATRENGGHQAHEYSTQYQLKVLRAEKHFITSLFTLVMFHVVFMRLREKNNYIKLLERVEGKTAEEEAAEETEKETVVKKQE
ncbi:hypothetical protein CcCBS67573_g07530 [Chytriomyces confervae]|uniref:BAP29/BAP31 transmembrane domain-containing protein n=1 Tax=Chytriomyces confervae TaxID=246404 RepID=A0A507ETW1_9FUNG|nr:hypothetical protein CcCBS67573_g07530 [Chytriomyces confervae]